MRWKISLLFASVIDIFLEKNPWHLFTCLHSFFPSLSTGLRKAKSFFIVCSRHTLSNIICRDKWPGAMTQKKAKLIKNVWIFQVNEHLVFFIWDYISCKTLGWKKGRIFNPKDATNNAAVSPDWRYLFHCSREKIPFHHWNLKKIREQKTACRAVLRLIKK